MEFVFLENATRQVCIGNAIRSNEYFRVEIGRLGLEEDGPEKTPEISPRDFRRAT